MTPTRMSFALPLLAAVAAYAAPAVAQNDHGNPNMAPVNDLPNPYSGRQVMPLPDGRTWGSTAGVDAAKGRDDIWAIDRCASNTCVGSHSNPLLHYDAAGNLIGQMGADLFAFPHGIHVDQEGNVWVTDPLPPDGRGAGGDVGQQVTKLSPTGEILLQLGTRKVAGDEPNQFSSPSDVVVGRNGDIFVADGHNQDGNNRIVKFSKDGKFIKAFGETGHGPGQLRAPHALAMDASGRIFVADRANQRIVIFDQDGKFLTRWTQFGMPSDIVIEANGKIYVADSESDMNENPGWEKGIRIGDVKTGWVEYFILDTGDNPPITAGGSGAESIAVDRHGNIFAGEPRPQRLQKYVKVR